MTYINVNDIEQMIEEGKIKHVYLDFDECVVDSINSVLIQLNRKYGTNYNMYDIHKWNMEDCFPNVTSIEIEDIFDSQEFFDNLIWKDGAIEFITKYHDMITVVTKGKRLNLDRKEVYIRKPFPSIDFIGLEGVVMDKSMVDMGLNSLHIDDNQSNLWSTDSEYKILYKNIENADWNKEWKGMWINNWITEVKQKKD